MATLVAHGFAPTAPKEPMWVHCSDCEYEWAALFLPAPMAEVAAVLKGIWCPYCRSKNIATGRTPKPTEAGNAEAWMVSGDTGTSSITIWSVMRGVTPRHADIPYDPDDFGRCYRLLKVMPSWRARLGEVADRYPKWRPFVDAWDELTALYEEELASGYLPRLYNRMEVCLGRTPTPLPAERPAPRRGRRR